jgi:hypothetical protein
MVRQPMRLGVFCYLAFGGACVGLTALPAAAETVITAMEYYIDTDPGAGNATPIPPLDGSYNSVQETGRVTLNTTGLKPGPHQVYVRAKNSNNVWGTYPPQLLNVYQRTYVKRVEYYIDSDPGLGNGTPLQAVDGAFDSITEAIKGSISTSGLSVGVHTLYVRAQNAPGTWGTTTSLRLEVLPLVKVIAAECAFGLPTDTVPTIMTMGAPWAMQAGFTGTVENVVCNAAPAPSPDGTYRAFVRAKNDRNMWGPWSYTSFKVGFTACQAWAAGYGLSGNNTVETADPDSDGVVNVIEYAFNMRPNQSDRKTLIPATGTSGLPCWSLQPVSGGRLLRVEYIRRKDDNNLKYTVMFSGDLSDKSWTPATETPSITTIDATWERVQVRDAPTNANALHRFGAVWIGW